MKRLVGLLGIVLLATAVLAGCASSGTEDDVSCEPTAFDPPGIRYLNTTDDPIVDDQDLAYEFETTNVRTCSLPAVGRNVLGTDGVAHRYIGEMDMRGDLDLGAVAVLGNEESPVVYLLDLTHRADPQVVSTIPQQGTHVVDVKFSDDGRVLYTASQLSDPASGAPAFLNGTSPLGFSVYNVEDPLAPVLLGTVADTGNGCHMLDPVQVDEGQDAVFCSSSQLRVYLIQRDGPTLVNLGFVDYVPSRGGQPTPGPAPVVSDPSCRLPVPGAPAPGVCALASRPHDVTVFHEETAFGRGSSYAVVSYWDEGLKVLDITDAPQVTEAGSWAGQGATHYAGNVHTAMAFEADGHRYIIASPEYTEGGTVPGLWVLLADDLANLELVAEWYHPGMHDSQGLYLTTHQWQVAPRGDVPADDVRIYLTYNHAGIWVLDFGSMLRGDHQDAILGYNLARAPIDPDTSVPNAILSTWDVNVVDGYIYGTDRATGLWVFHYEGDELGDERLNGYG